MAACGPWRCEVHHAPRTQLLLCASRVLNLAYVLLVLLCPTGDQCAAPGSVLPTCCPALPQPYAEADAKEAAAARKEEEAAAAAKTNGAAKAATKGEPKKVSRWPHAVTCLRARPLPRRLSCWELSSLSHAPRSLDGRSRNDALACLECMVQQCLRVHHTLLEPDLHTPCRTRRRRNRSRRTRWTLPWRTTA